LATRPVLPLLTHKLPLRVKGAHGTCIMCWLRTKFGIAGHRFPINHTSGILRDILKELQTERESFRLRELQN